MYYKSNHLVFRIILTGFTLNRLFLASLIIITLNCCKERKSFNQNTVKVLPVISTPIVSEKCDIIIYGTNEHGYTRPAIRHGYFSDTISYTESVNIEESFDISPSSISCDCELMSLTGTDPKTETTYTFLYNIKTKHLVNITREYKKEFLLPQFSPVSTKMAYIDSNKLQIINYKGFKNININNPKNVKFTKALWSKKDKYIYMEDDSTNIWRYNTIHETFNRIWKAPNKFSLSRMITMSENIEDVFYFISDHESDFTTIYRYGKDNKISAVAPTGYDSYLLQTAERNDTLYYKSNENGIYFLKQYVNGKTTNVFHQTDGEVVKYFNTRKGTIYHYADHNHPHSLYIRKSGDFINLIQGLVDSMPTPQIVYNKYGMINLVYFPKNTPKGWILLIHGGPLDQMIRTYDLHLSNFLRAGFGVIALNYPGSSGIGNSYEMRDEKNLIEMEVSSISEDLTQIRAKYPIINKVAVIGVSYGSILSRLYSLEHGNEITHLIEFSGLGDQSANDSIPILYIYGKNDFALDSTRLKMIQKDISKGNGKVFEIENEGHSIRNLKSREAILQQIIDFISDN